MFTDFLIGFVVVVTVLLIVTFAMNIWLRIPSVPTPLPIVDEMVKLAKLKNDDRVFDIGAGDGRMLIAAKRACGGIVAVGYEMIPTIWLIGKLRIFLSHTDVTLRRADALKQNYADADVIFLYLFPAFMEALVEKFKTELRSGTRIVSYMFKLPHHEPIETKKVRGFWGEATVYVYRW